MLKSYSLLLSTPAGAQADDDTLPLRLILCLALRFTPAQFYVSQLLLTVLFHVFFGLPLSRQPWGVHLRAYFVILLPAFLIVCPIQVHFLRVIVVSMEFCSAMFHNSLLVILSFQKSYSSSHYTGLFTLSPFTRSTLLSADCITMWCSLTSVSRWWDSLVNNTFVSINVHVVTLRRAWLIHTIRYDTIEEFSVDSKAEYTA